MRQRRLLRTALISAAATAAACLALAAPATAADPRGNNGTVKIDGVPVDSGPANEPHVLCNFAVQFFGFDKDQTADIVFQIWPPSGQKQTLLRLEDQTISDDKAGGGRDLDRTFSFSANDFDLGAFDAHPKQGYHIKLTVFSKGLPGGKKHKVFWLKPCKPTASPTTAPPTSTPTATSTRTGKTSPAVGPTALPVTGAGAAGTIGLLSLALALLGGGTLMLLRRRRDNLA